MGASEEGGALPVVSVIVPVYNALDYVGMALESALNQGYRGEELEIIVVDDGSTDGSGELLDRFAAEHAEVTVIHQESSGGPGAPRNAGLDIARGRYVFFLDADDELTPGRSATWSRWPSVSPRRWCSARWAAWGDASSPPRCSPRR